MQIRPLVLGMCAVFLTCNAGRARAESFTYQGQIQIHSVPGDPCAATSSEASYTISVYGRDDSSVQRIDGYVAGDKIVPAHVTGNNLGQLGVTFPGESAPSRAMQLRQLGAHYVLLNGGGPARDNIRRFAREVMPAFSDEPRIRVVGQL